MKYGMLTLIEDKVELQGRYWKSRYLCDCGNEVLKLKHNVRSLKTKSCGCVKKGNVGGNPKGRPKTHGLTNTREYQIHCSMKARCYNKKAINYKHYGEKGIKMCDRWLGDNGAVNFINDMGPAPSKDHSIDRIDSNGNYEPSNCRWETKSNQMINRSSWGKSKYKGVSSENKTLYRFTMIVNGINYSQRGFKTELEAAMAREIVIYRNGLNSIKNF